MKKYISKITANTSLYEQLKSVVPDPANDLDTHESDIYVLKTPETGKIIKKYYEDMPVNVAGKTGTAQESRNRANHALFVGYAPYENPEIAVATRVAFGYSSDYAAEISRDVFRYYFAPDEEDQILTGSANRPDAVDTGGD